MANSKTNSVYIDGSCGKVFPATFECENDVKKVNRCTYAYSSQHCRAISYSKILIRVKHSLPHDRATDFPLPEKRQEKSMVSTLVMSAMICNGF
jgi:hypothetical protein